MADGFVFFIFCLLFIFEAFFSLVVSLPAPLSFCHWKIVFAVAAQGKWLLERTPWSCSSPRVLVYRGQFYHTMLQFPPGIFLYSLRKALPALRYPLLTIWNIFKVRLWCWWWLNQVWGKDWIPSISVPLSQSSSNKLPILPPTPN